MKYKISNIYYGIPDDGSSLSHYGVVGMKWGVHRYQNPDGSLTADGRRRYHKEVRLENKKAFTLGREATYAGHVKEIARRKAEKADYRLSKHPNSERLAKKALIKKDLAERAKLKSDAAERAVEEHHKSLKEKYGEENVSDIKRNKLGNVHERTISGRDVASSVLLSAGSFAFSSAVGAPIWIISAPYTGREQGHRRYNMAYGAARKAYKKHERGLNAQTTAEYEKYMKEYMDLDGLAYKLL